VVGSSVHLLYGCDEMTNIVKRLRTNHPVGTKPDPLLFEAADEIESLRQQQVTWQTEAENTVSSLELEIEKLRQQLVACQARLAGTMGTPDAPPINLNALKRQWQREALLEAVQHIRANGGLTYGLENKAKELE
jgi:hypothetical protein